MILIAAMSENRVIGAGDGMPWDVPEEYEHYLTLTRGQTILMGRKTYEIFGPELSAAHAVVLTRSGVVEPLGNATLELASEFPRAVAAARSYGRTVFCGGGAAVYRLALPIADAICLSTIKGDFTGDAFFPEFDLAKWRVAEQRDQRRYRFARYVRLTNPDTPR